jgi:hypothetical protein
MGSHRTQKAEPTPANVRVPKNWPPLPCNIGKKRRITTIDGHIFHWQVQDEIVLRQTNSDRKIIVFQKMRCLEDSREEFRFGYYMIGLKPKARGRWVWGQFCLFVPKEDLRALIREAKKRKWL